jgi:hypothetical protein
MAQTPAASSSSAKVCERRRVAAKIARYRRVSSAFSDDLMWTMFAGWMQRTADLCLEDESICGSYETQF